VLRIVKLGVITKFFPPVSGKSSLTQSAMELLLNIAVPFIMMLTFAIITHLWVNDNLQYRCVPDPTSATAIEEIEADKYYQLYKEVFFYTRFNNRFCGEKQ
jgi:hypothetical protein